MSLKVLEKKNTNSSVNEDKLSPLILKKKNIYTSTNNSKLTPLTLKNKIEFRNIFFKYKNGVKFILNGVDISIEKGDRVGIIGETGSGKSTFVDIFMGLLEPSSGEIIVDGRNIYKGNNNHLVKSWRKSISHVPQEIFLADTSIAENIALSIPSDRIDMKKIRLAAQKAEIARFIESLPEKYQTGIGERGFLLSGGQRQRIGIARALYKEANVIVFDEATSALDEETEKKLWRTYIN